MNESWKLETEKKRKKQVRSTIKSSDALQNIKYNIKLRITFAHGAGVELCF